MSGLEEGPNIPNRDINEVDDDMAFADEQDPDADLSGGTGTSKPATGSLKHDRGVSAGTPISATTGKQPEREVIVIDDSDDDGGDDAWNEVPARSKKTKPSPAITNRAQPFDPFIVMLVGIPGSGKTTFCEMLTSVNPFKYERICQDVLGSRDKCEKACRNALREGKVPVVDRCNFDTVQRRHFMEIALKFSAPVDCIVFQYSREECVIRCQERPNHETIRASSAKRVVSFIGNKFKPPDNSEGLRTIRTVSSFQQANAIASDYLLA